jgi:hypothetical protein
MPLTSYKLIAKVANIELLLYCDTTPEYAELAFLLLNGQLKEFLDKQKQNSKDQVVSPFGKN